MVHICRQHRSRLLALNLRRLSLAFAPFAFGTCSFVFIGLIDPMAKDLDIGIPAIGRLQTIFAVACALGGPILARLLSQWDRKGLLLLVMAILTATSIGSAMAPNFGVLAGIRFAGGLFAALTLPLATTLAVSMVDEERRPAAIATVLAGYTLAFLVGMPLGSVLGDAFGWRAAFWFAAAISTVALALIGLGAPSGVARPDAGEASFAAALRGENAVLMFMTLAAFTATFCTVSFIGPVITGVSGLTGAAIGAVQIATGVGSLVGLPLGAMLARLPARRALRILLATTVLSQLLFFVGLEYDLGMIALPALLVAMISGSAALFATSPIIQSNIAKAAGAAATLAFALNGSMVYLGQGLGAYLGGIGIGQSGLPAVGLLGAGVAGAGLLLSARLKGRAMNDLD